MNEPFTKGDPLAMVATLRGQSVRPHRDSFRHFGGTIWVPKKYFLEWRTPLEAALAFLDDDDWENAVMEGAREVTVQ